MTDESAPQLAEVFAQVARRLGAGSDPDRTQEAVTDAAVELLEGCEHAAISLIRRHGRIDTVAATDDVPCRVDAIQYDTGEGPCLDAIREHETFLIGDLASDSRWRVFAPRAAHETGIASMLSFRLFLEEDTIGALNLYARKPWAFDEEDCALGAVLAAHAAIAMNAAREHQHAEHLEQALQSNRRIGMAVGILMVRHRLSEATTFELLRRCSQYLNRKMRDVAEDVIVTGELPATTELKD